MQQQQCHKCGRNIPNDSGVYRVMKTGTYSSGQDYFRNVNLCPQCDEGQNSKERLEKGKKALLILAAVVAAVAAGVYLLFFR